MSQDDFIARCRAQILQQGKEAAVSHYQALVREMAELEGLGIGLTFAEVYSVGPYRYSDLTLAVKQARRMQSSGSEA
jgi:hypothetical protein